MPPNRAYKTYSIINGPAIAGPFSYLLTPALKAFYLTLLNSSVASHSLPAHCKGSILLLVKGVYWAGGCYLAKRAAPVRRESTSSACGTSFKGGIFDASQQKVTSIISTAAFQEITTSPLNREAPHDDALIGLGVGMIDTVMSTEIAIHQPGSTVVMSHNQGNTDLNGVFLNRRLALLLFLGGVPAPGGGGGQEGDGRNNSPMACIQSRTALPLHREWSTPYPHQRGTQDVERRTSPTSQHGVAIPRPGSTVVMSHNQGTTDLNGVFLNRRLFFCYFSFAAKRKVRQAERGDNGPMVKNESKTTLPHHRESPPPSCGHPHQRGTKRLATTVEGLTQDTSTKTPEICSYTCMHTHSCTILVADDDSDDIGMLDEIFKELQPELRVVTADSGRQAVKLLLGYTDTQLPDLVVLDYNMPDMTGAEVLQAICKDGRYNDIPKVVLSTSDASLYEQICKQSGATYYFKKPDNIDDIQLLAQKLLMLCPLMNNYL